MDASYEFFDHTADMGIRVRAESLAELIAPAGAALYAAIGELSAGGEAHRVSFDLTGGDKADLLRDYLTELLVLFERDGVIVTDSDVDTFGDGRLIVSGHAQPYDKERSVLLREVKAITYHDLAINEIPGGYEAVLIVDI